MLSRFRFLLIPLLLIAIGALLFFQFRRADAEARNTSSPPKPDGGFVTLYANDPITSSISFTDGQPGRIFQDHMVRNRNTDLDFGNFLVNGFSVAVEGSREGAIVDIGTPDELQAKYGYEETVGGGQGFASIRLENGKVVIARDSAQGTTQELAEAAPLFGQLKASAGIAPVKANHIYLIRIADKSDKDFQLFVKVLCVNYRAQYYAVLRWAKM